VRVGRGCCDRCCIEEVRVADMVAKHKAVLCSFSTQRTIAHALFREHNARRITWLHTSVQPPNIIPFFRWTSLQPNLHRRCPLLSPQCPHSSLLYTQCARDLSSHTLAPDVGPSLPCVCGLAGSLEARRVPSPPPVQSAAVFPIQQSRTEMLLRHSHLVNADALQSQI